MTNKADSIQMRHSYMPGNHRLTTREGMNNEKYIQGYFIVFNQRTELWPGVFEQVAPSAADESVANNDIRCLYNHDSNIILGRKSVNTADFRIDSKGLWGEVLINENDTDALNAYERVKRGDISGCSYGYYPEAESYEELADGSVLWTEEKVDIKEVSICTFPQYEQTEVEARSKEYAAHKGKHAEQRKKELKKRLEDLKNA